MAVVSTETVLFEGADFKKKVRVNKDGLFRIGWPQRVIDRLGEPKDAVAETLEDANKLWRERVKEYTEAQTSRRKVIRYKIKFSCDIQKNVLGRQTEILKRRDSGFDDGIAIAVWARVYIEECVDRGPKGKRYNYEPTHSSIPHSLRQSMSVMPDFLQGKRDKCCMDWTPEREAFFCRMAELMEELALKLATITDEPNEFADLAQTLAGPLLPSGES